VRAYFQGDHYTLERKYRRTRSYPNRPRQNGPGLSADNFFTRDRCLFLVRARAHSIVSVRLGYYYICTHRPCVDCRVTTAYERGRVSDVPDPKRLKIRSLSSRVYGKSIQTRARRCGPPSQRRIPTTIDNNTYVQRQTAPGTRTHLVWDRIGVIRTGRCVCICVYRDTKMNENGLVERSCRCCLLFATDRPCRIVVT